MTFVLDTSVLIDHLRDRPGATEALGGALRSGRRVTASVLSRVELRRGARPDELGAIEAVEILVDWIAVDHEIAALAAELAERHGRSEGALDVVDFVVAATTQRLGAELLTRDVRRFPMLAGLTAPY